jgi:hypothetical protein
LGEHLDAEVGGIWLAQRRPATSVKVSKLCLGAEIAAMPSAEQRVAELVERAGALAA